MSATAPTVFITVPKYLAITPGTNATIALPKLKPAPTTVVTPVAAEAEDGAPKGKKRRLDHLSWEEKVQRKKLKNRVAAQTSRDRKKARMEEMEYELKELGQRTELLQNKCESLQAINDSLLEKNQKLDMELEILRQQLTELQQQQQQQSANSTATSTQKVDTCAGSGLNSKGLTVDTRPTEKEQQLSSALEDCCSLPTLQDMLLIDEDFDAGKLEELAESLLADITADMEADDRESDEAVAQVAGRTERLPGSVVGTTAECLESSQHSTACSTRSSCLSNDKTNQETTTATEVTIKKELQPTCVIQSKIQTDATTTATPTNATTALPIATPDTVYGTYDAKTNSITIVMDDDTVPVNEAVEEIYCEGVCPPAATDVDGIKCPTPVASPSQVYLNVDCDYEDDDEDLLNFDPLAKFLCPKRPLISPLAKSPAPSLHSATSDHGYESIMGSPTPTSLGHFDPDSMEDEFAWHGNSFTELFPMLM